MDGAAESSPYLSQPLGQILKAMELVTEGHIQEALQIQRREGGLFGQILIRLGYIHHEELVLALAEQKGVDIRDLERKADPDPPSGFHC